MEYWIYTRMALLGLLDNYWGVNRMKYNNQYYKLIAQLLDESVDNQHHTDLYYSKRIAESYGETYTDLGNVNKHLRDFAEDVGVELDNKHHTRLWYLKRIADKLYDGELEHNTENYYLRIISENIQPTPPTPVDAIIFEIDGNRFMSNNNSPFEYTGEVLIDWGDNTTETYNGGKLTHNYASSGEYTIKITGNITALGQTSFAGNSSKRITLSNSITSIGAYCFGGCSNLEEIILPNNLTTLADGTLMSCPKLSSITIPNNVATIGYSCFASDTDLETVTLPNSLLTLGDSAFDGCGKIEVVTIPSSVSTIGRFVFGGCANLTEIILEWTESSEIIQYNSEWIKNDVSFNHFLIPTGTTSLYEAKGYPSNKLQEK